MDRTEAFPEGVAVAPGERRLHFGKDGERHFLGIISTKIQANRRVQARAHLRRDGKSVRCQVGQ